MRNWLFLSLSLVISLYTARCVLRENPNSLVPNVDKLYPSEEYFLSKQFPETSFHIKAYDLALDNVKKFSNNRSNRSSGTWEVQGPGNIGARANCIAIDPKNANIIFIGYSEGGLFRSKDGGQNWTPVFDKESRLTIGDITFDPLNSKNIYVGTGDPNISGFPFIGDGIYKSTDGGDTWKNMGLKDTRIISKIEVSNTDPNIVYAASMGLPFTKNLSRGLYKSTNGGQSWSQILFINDSTGVIDLAVHPSNDKIIYAVGWNRIRNNKKSLVAGPDSKIHKSIDGGITWNILANGLPQDESSRIGLTLCRSNPNVLYASYVSGSDLNLRNIYKSTNSGASWDTITTTEDKGFNPGVFAGFGWYFDQISVNPYDENDIFVMGVDLYRSKNGGESWNLAAPPWYTYEVHADKHDLIFNDTKMFLATDGGVYKSDIENELWEDIENIPTTQFYRVGYNPHEPDLYYGGAQDNGTTGGNLLTINDWERIYGGDGFQPIFHPINPNIFYVETQNGGIARTDNGGLDFYDATLGIESSDPTNWDTPIIMSAHDPNVMYTGTNRIYKSTTGGQGEWTAISSKLTDDNSAFLRKNIATIHESPVDSNQICAGTSDGLVWATDDMGATWENVSSGLPNKYVSSVCYSPDVEGTVFVSFTGYKDNDNTPYIYYSKDNGKKWKSIQGNLPLIAINNVLVLPHGNNTDEFTIVAATDGGVFYTNSSGDSWFRMGDNMPFVAVYDVEYNPVNNQIIAGTFGRSIQTFDLEQIGYGISSTVDNKYNNFKASLLNSINAHSIIVKIGNIQEKLKYNIIDVNGTTVSTGQIINDLESICIESLSIGLHFLTIQDSKQRQTLKFIKI